MISYTWDERKARRNEREHHVSFTLAEQALREGLGLPVEEQFRNGEWRTKVLAPIRGILILTIVVSRGEGDEDEDSSAYPEDDVETIRIISARKATPGERLLYAQAHPRQTD